MFSDNLLSTGVPQGSVLGPIHFFILINDFHEAVQFSLVYQYADDTNFLLTENSLKKLNKHINLDLKLVTTWIRVNKHKKQRLSFSNQEASKL